MTNSEPSELFAAHLATLDARVRGALAEAGADALVVHAGPEQYVFRDDQTYPFVAEPYFKAWVPLARAPGSVLKIEPGQRPLLAYLQPEDYWYESPADPEGFWAEHFDVRVVRTAAEASAAIQPHAARSAAIGERVDAQSGFRSINDPALLRRLDFDRAVKTPYEAACVRRAAASAARGHGAVGRLFAPGVAEFDLHLEYCRASGQREIDLPYPNIIALNEHAAILHYQNARRRAPETARSFLIDAGAQHNGYACDITRTWHLGGGRFAALCDAMERLQQTLCAGARSGVDFVDLNEEAHRLLAGVLHEHGLVRCSPEEALDEGITTAFLPHGLGHLLGLQVHDAGGRQVDPEGRERPPPERHPFLRLTRVLAPGFVVTIEPGLYFIPALLKKLPPRAAAMLNRDAVEDLLPFGGIRVEDDVLVTPEGPRNLTREAFAELSAA